MWAAAFLTFLLVPGLGAALLLSAAVTTYVKSTKVDAEYAKRGEMPPTARLVEAWLNRQKASGKQPATATVNSYGSRAYAKQRWAAFWEDLGDKHREERAAHQRAVADAKKNGTPLPGQPSAKERLKGWKWAVDLLVRPVADKPTPNNPATAAPADPVPAPATDGPIIACDECGVRLADTTGGYRHPDGSTCAKASTVMPHRRTGPGTVVHSPDTTEVQILQTGDQWGWSCRNRSCPAKGFDYPSQAEAASAAGQHRCRQVPTVQPTSAGDATCPPAGPRQDPAGAPVRNLPNEPADIYRSDPNRILEPEGEDMTATAQQQSGEVTGIPSAINYLEQMAGVHQRHAGNEALTSRLAAFRVGPTDLALVQAAMTASQDAAELYRVAAAAIEKSNAAVRQGYASAPDAADKHAQLAE